MMVDNVYTQTGEENYNAVQLRGQLSVPNHKKREFKNKSCITFN